MLHRDPSFTLRMTPGVRDVFIPDGSGPSAHSGIASPCLIQDLSYSRYVSLNWCEMSFMKA